VLAADRARESAAGDLLLATLAAETDVMTGLYNKRAWERLVAEEEARFTRFADPTVAVILDLDQLKTVNDTQGHKAGDAYIRDAANALRRAVRASDIAARLGGDEFGLLMLGCTEVQAEAAVMRIYAELSDAGVAGSVGWAPVTVVRGSPAAGDAADRAMYIAKRNRRAKRKTATTA
jgi:diguanylate cyclase